MARLTQLAVNQTKSLANTHFFIFEYRFVHYKFSPDEGFVGKGGRWHFDNIRPNENRRQYFGWRNSVGKCNSNTWAQNSAHNIIRVNTPLCTTIAFPP